MAQAGERGGRGRGVLYKEDREPSEEADPAAGARSGSPTVPEEVGDTVPGPKAQVEKFPKGNGSRDGILEQKSGVPCTCATALHVKNTDFAACASKRTLIFFRHHGPHKPLCQAPRGSQTLGSCPCPSLSTPKDALGRTLSTFCTSPRTAGLMETFPRCFSVPLRRLLGKVLLQALLSPRRLHPPVFAARSCVTKGISPANRTCKHAAESRLPEFRVITPRQCVFFLCVI